MKIELNGKKVGKNCVAYYFENKATFKKEGLNRKTVLHELYHHLVASKGFQKTERVEEKESNFYSRTFLKS